MKWEAWWPSFGQAKGLDTIHPTLRDLSFSLRINSEANPVSRPLTFNDNRYRTDLQFKTIKYTYSEAVWCRNSKCSRNKNKLVLARPFGDITWHLWAVFRNKWASIHSRLWHRFCLHCYYASTCFRDSCWSFSFSPFKGPSTISFEVYFLFLKSRRAKLQK